MRSQFPNPALYGSLRSRGRCAPFSLPSHLSPYPRVPVLVYKIRAALRALERHVQWPPPTAGDQPRGSPVTNLRALSLPCVSHVIYLHVIYLHVIYLPSLLKPPPVTRSSPYISMLLYHHLISTYLPPGDHPRRGCAAHFLRLPRGVATVPRGVACPTAHVMRMRLVGAVDQTSPSTSLRPPPSDTWHRPCYDDVDP